MNIITRKKHLAASWDVFPSGLLGEVFDLIGITSTLRVLYQL